MKTLTFNTDSWHWYLAHEMGDYDPMRHGDNLCAYTRRFLIGSMKMAGFLVLMSLLIAGNGYLFWNVLFGVIFSIMLHSWMFTVEGMTVLILGGAALGLAALYMVFRLVVRGISRGAEVVAANTIEKQDSFAANAYNAWHDKFCAKLEFNEVEETE